ncbi:MAG: hypothetical protein ACR2KG_04195 [Nocardioidaceae bacterium]
MSNRIIALAMVTATVVLSAAVTVGLLHAVGSCPWAGPLNVGSGSSQSMVVARPHEPMTWSAFNMISNDTDQSMVIDKVTIPSASGLIKDVVAFDPNKYGYAGDDNGWPARAVPNAPMTPPQGSVITPHRTLDIVVELVAPGVGVYRAGPITVDYHIGSTNYRTTVPSWGVVCTLPHATTTNQKRCDPPMP